LVGKVLRLPSSRQLKVLLGFIALGGRRNW
jgi:hypothetical protein